MKATKEEKAKGLTRLLKSEIRARHYLIREVAEHWGITPRRMSQILKNPSRMNIDAIYGLSSKYSFIKDK